MLIHSNLKHTEKKSFGGTKNTNTTPVDLKDHLCSYQQQQKTYQLYKIFLQLENVVFVFKQKEKKSGQHNVINKDH